MQPTDAALLVGVCITLSVFKFLNSSLSRLLDLTFSEAFSAQLDRGRWCVIWANRPHGLHWAVTIPLLLLHCPVARYVTR